MFVLFTFGCEDDMIYLQHLNSDVKLQFARFPLFSKFENYSEFASIDNGKGVYEDFENSKSHQIHLKHPLAVYSRDLIKFDKLFASDLSTIKEQIENGDDTRALLELESLAKKQYYESFQKWQDRQKEKVQRYEHEKEEEAKREQAIQELNDFVLEKTKRI